MKSVNINASKSYNVYIEKGLFSRIGEMISYLYPGRRLFVISDDRVFSFYGNRLEEILREAGFDFHVMLIPNGEASKNTDNLIRALEEAAAFGMTRSDVFVAFGGGVVGDLCGFTAATYMRGVDYIGIPTTFLAAIDSSVGGKTAVDLKAGKNLMGAFHQPSLVLCDPELFSTLTDEAFTCGTAEAIKYGVIRSQDLFDVLQGDFSDSIESVVAHCVEIKRDIVEEDEFDHGERKKLNFGHTVGHAIEKLSEYSIPHGHAVMLGMIEAAKCAERLGIAKNGIASVLVSAAEKNRLPITHIYSAREIADAASCDKKREGAKLSLILPETIGSVRIVDIKADEFINYIF